MLPGPTSLSTATVSPNAVVASDLITHRTIATWTPDAVSVEVIISRSTANSWLRSVHRTRAKSTRDCLCVHCNGNHTAGYTECTERLKFIKARNNRNQRWTNAPAPTSNPLQTRPQQQNPSRIQTNIQQVIPPMPIMPLNFVNNSFKQQPPQPPLPTHNNTDSEKFTAQEIASIFNHILDCVDKCTNKRDQLRILTNVVAQYYI